jgi:hypothetical protein
MRSVEQFKGLVAKGQGFARPNFYRVILPSVIGGVKFPIVGELLNRGISNLKRTIPAEDINMLCTATNMPGRNLLTHDRRIGMVNKKVAYGYAVEDVTLTFRVLNDFRIKEYFEAWQNSAVTTEYELKYFNDYSEDVVIQALTNSPDADYDKLLRLSYAGLDQGGLATALAGGESVVYTCVLQNAYPTQVLQMQMSDAQADQLLELNVQLSYKDWSRKISNKTDFRDSLRNRITDFAIDKVKEKLFG